MRARGKVGKNGESVPCETVVRVLLIATGILFVLGVALFLYDFFVLAPRRALPEAEGPREPRPGVVPREA